MQRKINSHDKEKGIVDVTFEHTGVIITQQLSLKELRPGAKAILEQMGIEFDEALQMKELDKYTQLLQTQIDNGEYRIPEEPKTVPYTPPPKAEPVGSKVKDMTKSK